MPTNKLKPYYVLWTYMANYSELICILTSSPEEAVKLTTGYFGEKFHEMGNSYVFDTKPVLVKGPDLENFKKLEAWAKTHS